MSATDPATVRVAPFGDAYLLTDISQGVDGPARPPVTFPRGTRVIRGSQVGDLVHVEARHPLYPSGQATAMLVVRASEIADLYVGLSTTRYE